MLSSPKTKPFLCFAILALSAAAILTLSLNSCTPEYGMSTEDYDIVATLYDKTFDFGAIGTFAMPDSIIHVIDTSKEDDLSREFDSLILSEVAWNMENLGYTREMDPQNNGTDVILLVYATSSTNYIYYPWYPWNDYWCWWPGWGYYPPGCGPGWGPIYPPYWPSGSYRVGTLVIDMIDPEAIDDNEEAIPSKWVALMNGLLNEVNSEQRIVNNIAQAFNQSPYLGARP